MAPLQGTTFDFAPLVARAVACESDEQTDREDGDVDDFTSDELDESLPPPNFWDDIDDIDPTPPKRPRATSFEEVVASSKKPHTGAHRHRPAKPALAGKAAQKAKSTTAANSRRTAKRAREFVDTGRVASAAVTNAHVRPAVPLDTELDTSSLPTKVGAYSAKPETKPERRGSKVPRSLVNLLGLGFHLIKWDGM